MITRPLLLLVASFGLGCASAPGTPASPTVLCLEAPESEPAPQQKPQIPEVAESVSVRLFVVAPSGNPAETGMPKAILGEPVCDEGVCEVLYAPLFVGREHSEMVLEVGDREAPSLLSVNTRAALRGDTVDVKLNGRFVGAEGPMSVEFRGALQTGELTHIGTFNGQRAEVGPHVYAQVSQAVPDEA